MCVSPGAFFSPDSREFPWICHGRHVWRFEFCASFLSQFFFLSLSSGSCSLGHFCQPECLHRHALDFYLAFASFLEALSAIVFTPSVVFIPDVCASGEELCLVPSLASPFPVWLSNPFSVLIVVPVPSDLFLSKVFLLVWVSLATWSPFGTSLQHFPEGILIISYFSLFFCGWLWFLTRSYLKSFRLLLGFPQQRGRPMGQVSGWWVTDGCCISGGQLRII